MNIQYSFGTPLKQQYVDYIWYDSFFFEHEVRQINAMWDQAKAEKAPLSGAEDNDASIRRSSATFLPHTNETDWVYKKLAMLVQQTNFERFHFDLLGFYQELQLTEYNEGDFFEWHMDFGAGEISHRKLSITVQLSAPDKYEGGELQFLINQTPVNASRKKGTVVVFPSFVTHRVTPVISGTRRSIVAWASGTPYR